MLLGLLSCVGPYLSAQPSPLHLEKAVSCRALHEMESAKVHAEPWLRAGSAGMVPVPPASQLHALPLA